jgi:hypothetical protein
MATMQRDDDMPATCWIAPDADRDVELRADRLARLPDLVAVRPPAGIDHRARRTDGAADRVGQRLDEREVLGGLEPAATAHDDLGLGQNRACHRSARSCP